MFTLGQQRALRLSPIPQLSLTQGFQTQCDPNTVHVLFCTGARTLFCRTSLYTLPSLKHIQRPGSLPEFYHSARCPAVLGAAVHTYSQWLKLTLDFFPTRCTSSSKCITCSFFPPILIYYLSDRLMFLSKERTRVTKEEFNSNARGNQERHATILPPHSSQGQGREAT